MSIVFTGKFGKDYVGTAALRLSTERSSAVWRNLLPDAPNAEPTVEERPFKGRVEIP